MGEKEKVGEGGGGYGQDKLFEKLCLPLSRGNIPGVQGPENRPFLSHFLPLTLRKRHSEKC